MQDLNIITVLCEAAADFKADLESELQEVVTGLQTQRCLIGAIIGDAGINPNTQPPDPAVANLFKHLFGGVKLPCAKIRCIYTPLQIYFYLSFPDPEEEANPTNGWEQVTAWTTHLPRPVYDRRRACVDRCSPRAALFPR